jgi:hypothetical protein
MLSGSGVADIDCGESTEVVKDWVIHSVVSSGARTMVFLVVIV